MGIGGTINLEQSKELLNLWQKYSYKEIDTSIMYQGGKSEKTLGELKAGQTFSIAIKANPWYNITTNTTTLDQANGLSAEALKKQLHESLQNLNSNRAHIFYLHAPDHNTPLIETLTAIHELQQLNLFDEWGLSNFPAWQVVHIYHLCKENKFQPPTVYQGMYNCITRDVEKELFPALKLCGMRFYAFNPLAGGILTGRYSLSDDPSNGRFSNKTVWGERYRERFWKKPIFDAIQLIETSCQKHNIPLLQASLSWLYHHSAMSASRGDGVIIGGSSLNQIQSNVEAVNLMKPLPEEVVKSIEEAWQIAAPVCQQYWR